MSAQEKIATTFDGRSSTSTRDVRWTLLMIYGSFAMVNLVLPFVWTVWLAVDCAFSVQYAFACCFVASYAAMLAVLVMYLRARGAMPSYRGVKFIHGINDLTVSVYSVRREYDRMQTMHAVLRHVPQDIAVSILLFLFE